MGIWREVNYKSDTLEKDIEVETLIIGGGLTGIMSAYYLNNENVCVVDKNTFGSGVTKNTTAKITYLQENIYSKIKFWRGDTAAKEYLKSQLFGINEYIRIITKENIDCDLEKTPSYIFASTKASIPKLQKEYQFLKNTGVNIQKDDLEVNIKNYLSYKVTDTYTFNPLKFLTQIINILNKKNIKLYENTEIVNISKVNGKYLCKTNKHNIVAKNIIIASNYPHFLFPLVFPLKCSIEKSHIIVSKVTDNKNFSCININKPTYSCRFYKDYQISLGCSHTLSFKENNKKNFAKVKQEFNLSEENIVMEYSNTDIITPDYLPLIGKLKNHMYISTGYNTWGMINSLLGAFVLSELIVKNQNNYEIFNPKRITIAGLIKLPLYIFNNIKSFLISKLIKNKPWYTDVYIENNIGKYKDPEGIIHKVKTKCPHLGCSLTFNEVEKTWDCPCHSSRFDIDGNCIKGPSIKNIKIDN